MTDECAIILRRLMALCSRSEKCEYDASEYMLSHGATQEQADIAVEYLVANNYVDNERYADSFAADKFRFAKWGARKIAAALKQKHIPGDLIVAALDKAIEPEREKQIVEYEMAKKLRGIKCDAKQEAWQKLMRFGATRGYRVDICKEIISRLLSDAGREQS
ncbi:MAG: RecX family transcriptional regulator [Bacteroidales bacterium]|nr:RecX family transcriptional regulator [Bacteroidales bacterium]